jgi:UTP-glucose-1-phosphate uridylyltransferase
VSQPELDGCALRPIASSPHLRSPVERVVEEGIVTNAFVAHGPERAIAYIFDASYRFTHSLASRQDAGVPRDLIEARLDAVILAIQRALRTSIM